MEFLYVGGGIFVSLQTMRGIYYVSIALMYPFDVNYTHEYLKLQLHFNLKCIRYKQNVNRIFNGFDLYDRKKYLCTVNYHTGWYTFCCFIYVMQNMITSNYWCVHPGQAGCIVLRDCHQFVMGGHSTHMIAYQLVWLGWPLMEFWRGWLLCGAGFRQMYFEMMEIEI